MAAKIEIIVGANTSQADAALKKTEQQIVSTGKAVQGLDQKMTGGLTKGANQAGVALRNFGLIAQDAPFGIIGITNNINPLLESFQRLKAETGSTKNALAALGSSLVGGAGLGLAISVITGLLTVLAQTGFFNSTKAAEENTEAVKQSISAYDKFQSELSKVITTIGQEATKVSILFSALSDSNIGLRERKGIIEQLNTISPGYLGNLDKEKASYVEIAKAVFAYTNSLAQSSEVKALLPQVEEIFNKLIKTQVELNQLRRFQGGALGLSDEDFKAEEKRLNDQISLYTKQIQQAKKGLEFIAGGALNLSEILFGKTPALSKEKVKEIETVFSVLEDLKKKLRDIVVTGFALDEKTITEKIGAIQGTIKKLISDFNLDETNINIKRLRLKIDNLQAVNEVQEKITQAVAQPGSAGSALQITVPIKPKIVLPETTDSFKEVDQQVSAIFKEIGVNAATSFGESLGDAISGTGGGIESFFEGLYKSLGAGLKQLGKYFIQTAIEVRIFKEFITKNPYLAIAAGIALTALGQVIQNATAKKKAFARGGFVPGVGNTDSVDAALMPGEFVLRKSAVQAIGLPNLSLLNAGVMPAAAVSPGMQTVQIVGEGMISGENIYVAYKRYEQRRGRNT